MDIVIFNLKIYFLISPRSDTLMPAQVLDCRNEVPLNVSAADAASRAVNRYAKHVFNCLKPRNVLYLTTAYFKVCQLWGFCKLPVSLFEHAHENNCEWLILITAGSGQILGYEDGFLLKRVEEFVWAGELWNFTSMNGELRKEHVCSPIAYAYLTANASGVRVCRKYRKHLKLVLVMAGGEDNQWLLLLLYSVSSVLF